MAIERFKLLVPDERKPRRIAVRLYRAHEKSQGHSLIIALPGLLETQESFVGLTQRLEKHFSILTFDWVGRGQSDWLEDSSRYRMSLYLKDLGLIYSFAHGLVLGASHIGHGPLQDESQTAPGIVMVGTSMGGLVALAYAAMRPEGLSRIILNDVGSLLPWTGILGLMTGLHGATKTSGLFSNPQDLAKELQVDPHLIRAVQKPGHLDLPYEATLSGVDFSAVFRAVQEPILVLKAGQSEMVDDNALGQLDNKAIKLVPFEAATHPVPYDDTSCSVIKNFLEASKP